MNNLPSFETYGKYNGDNYGVHSLKIDMGAFSLYYSYQTIIAYEDDKEGLVCCTNVWRTTTGKHLNWIQPNKKLRLPHDEFSVKLKDMLNRHITTEN